jgi:hypothetical protein
MAFITRVFMVRCCISILVDILFFNGVLLTLASMFTVMLPKWLACLICPLVFIWKYVMRFVEWLHRKLNRNAWKVAVEWYPKATPLPAGFCDEMKITNKLLGKDDVTGHGVKEDDCLLTVRVFLKPREKNTRCGGFKSEKSEKSDKWRILTVKRLSKKGEKDGETEEEKEEGKNGEKEKEKEGGKDGETEEKDGGKEGGKKEEREGENEGENGRAKGKGKEREKQVFKWWLKDKTWFKRRRLEKCWLQMRMKRQIALGCGLPKYQYVLTTDGGKDQMLVKEGGTDMIGDQIAGKQHCLFRLVCLVLTPPCPQSTGLPLLRYGSPTLLSECRTCAYSVCGGFPLRYPMPLARPRIILEHS